MTLELSKSVRWLNDLACPCIATCLNKSKTRNLVIEQTRLKGLTCVHMSTPCSYQITNEMIQCNNFDRSEGIHVPANFAKHRHEIFPQECQDFQDDLNMSNAIASSIFPLTIKELTLFCLHWAK